MLEDYESNFDKISKRKLYSDGKSKIDTSIYTGSGGVVFTYYKLWSYFSYKSSNVQLPPNVESPDL